MKDPEGLLRRALVFIEDARASKGWGSDEQVKLAADIREALKGETDVRTQETVSLRSRAQAPAA